MKKILILGGSHRDIPLIKASKELGFYVITLGDRAYYKGHNYSDKKYLIDFNNLEKVRETIKKEGIKYIVAGCGEASYISTVILANEFNISNYDSVETAKLVHNKWLFKEFCLTNGVSTPKGCFYSEECNLSDIKFPLVIKPTTLSGGRGVEIVETKLEFERAIEDTLQYSQEIFIEEFIEGELVAYSVFIQNKKIIYGFMGKDEMYLNKYLVAYAYPIEFTQEVKNKLDKDINHIAQKLNLVDGMFHLQVILRDNIPYIIDVTRRIPGDFYPDLIELCSGVQYSQAVVKSYIGDAISNEFTIKRDDFIIRYVVMPNRNGIYKNIHIDKSIESKIVQRFDLIEKGFTIDDYTTTQLAILFIKLDFKDEKVINNITNLVEVEVDKLF